MISHSWGRPAAALRLQPLPSRNTFAGMATALGVSEGLGAGAGVAGEGGIGVAVGDGVGVENWQSGSFPAVQPMGQQPSLTALQELIGS